MYEIRSSGDQPTRYSAYIDGCEVGLLIVDLIDPLIQVVNTIYVDPEYRRLGIGTALWSAAKLDWPYLQHAQEMTSDGFQWATSLGQSFVVNKVWRRS